MKRWSPRKISLGTVRRMDVAISWLLINRKTLSMQVINAGKGRLSTGKLRFSFVLAKDQEWCPNRDGLLRIWRLQGLRRLFFPQFHETGKVRAINESVTHATRNRADRVWRPKKGFPFDRKGLCVCTFQKLAGPTSKRQRLSAGPTHQGWNPFPSAVDTSTLAKAGASQPEMQPGAHTLRQASESLTKC